jgi:AraC-like DNA-binding protein
LPGGQILYFYENNFLPFYKTYNPPASLNKIIREFQVYHANWNEENNLPPPFITCLANTEQNLYFYLKDPVKLVIAAGKEIPVPPAVVTGPKYKTVGLLFGKEHLMVKIAFHPTGTYRLLDINMQQTINNGLNAAEFWGDDVNKLVEQLKQNISYDSMIEIVCRFIEQRFDQSCRCEEPIDDVAIQMLDPLKNYTLEEWAAMACLSLRQFERNFITRVGISPKLFIRIVRFEYAMKIKNDYPEKNWSEIALECGYTDSSHLLKEFKEFAEFPPSRFYLQPTSGYSEFPTG